MIKNLILPVVCMVALGASCCPHAIQKQRCGKYHHSGDLNFKESLEEALENLENAKANSPHDYHELSEAILTVSAAQITAGKFSRSIENSNEAIGISKYIEDEADRYRIQATAGELLVQAGAVKRGEELLREIVVSDAVERPRLQGTWLFAVHRLSYILEMKRESGRRAELLERSISRARKAGVSKWPQIDQMQMLHLMTSISSGDCSKVLGELLVIGSDIIIGSEDEVCCQDCLADKTEYLIGISGVLASCGMTEEFMAVLDDVKAYYHGRSGSDRDISVKLLNFEVEVAVGTKDNERAVGFLSRLVEADESSLGSRHPRTLSNKALYKVFRAVKDGSDADLLAAEKIVGELEDSLDRQHQLLPFVYEYLSEAYSVRGDLKKATLTAQKEVDTCRAVFGRTAIRCIEAQRRLAGFLKGIARTQEAEENLVESCMEEKKRPDCCSFGYYDVMNSLGEMALFRGDYDLSEKRYLDVLNGNKLAAVSQRMEAQGRLSNVYAARGDYTAAIAAYSEYYELKNPSACSEDSFDSLVSLSILKAKTGKIEEAYRLLATALMGGNFTSKGISGAKLALDYVVPKLRKEGFEKKAEFLEKLAEFAGEEKEY